MTEIDGIEANIKVEDDVQLTDDTSENKDPHGCMCCCPQPILAYRKIQKCFTCMSTVKSETVDYGAKSFMTQTANRKELFSRLGYSSDPDKFQAGYEMPYLTWSFCQKHQLQPGPDLTLKNTDQVLHAKDVMFFAKILSVRKDSMWYLARWRHQEDGWLWVKSTRKHSTPKEIIDMELRCYSRTRERPFFLQLIQAFQTPSAYYLVTPYSGRCTLRYVIRTRGEQSVNNVMFYVMELVHALIYLHEHDIILRNLNPDTVMLDQEGHTFISDFSLADVSGTPVAERNQDTVPIFNLAPEVIKNGNYTKSMDWWSLGSIIYCLLYGQEPFKESNSFKIVTAILTRQPRFTHKTYGFQLISFCKELLRKSPHHRLGSGTSGSLSVIGHSCLRLVDWAKVASRKFAPPFAPPEELHLSHGAGDLKELQTPSATYLADNCMSSRDIAAFQEQTYLPFNSDPYPCDDEIKHKIRCLEPLTATGTAVNFRRRYLVAAELSELEALQSRQKARRASKVHDDVSMFEKPPSGLVLDCWTQARGREIRNYAGAEKAEAALIDSPTKIVVDDTKCSCGDVLKGQLRDMNRSNAGRCCQHEMGDGSKSCPRGANPHSRCVLHIVFDKAPNGGPRERVVFGSHVYDSHHGAVGDQNNSGVFDGADSEKEDVDVVVNQSRGEDFVPGTLGDSESTEPINDSRADSKDSRLPPNDGSSVSDSLPGISHPDAENVSPSHPGSPHLLYLNETLSQSRVTEHATEGSHSDNAMTSTPEISEHSTRLGISPKINQNRHNDARNYVHQADSQQMCDQPVPPCNHLFCELKVQAAPGLKLVADSDSYSNESDKIACSKHTLTTTKEAERLPKDDLPRKQTCDNETDESNMKTANIRTEFTRSSNEESDNRSYKREILNSVDLRIPTADSGEVKNDLATKKSPVRFNSLPSLAFGKSQSVETPPPCSFLGYVTSRLEDHCADESFSRFCQKSTSAIQKVRYPVRAESYQLQYLFQNSVARKPDPRAGREDDLPLGEEHVDIRTGQFEITAMDGVRTRQDSRSPGKASFWKRLVMQVKNSEVVHRGKPGCEYESAEASTKNSNAKHKNRFPFFRTPRPLDPLDGIRDSTKASPFYKTKLNVGSLSSNQTPSKPDPRGSVRILSECMHMQTPLATNSKIDFPMDSKGAHKSCSIENSKMELSGAGHLFPFDGSSDIPHWSEKERSGQFSLVERMEHLEIRQVQSLSKEKSNGGWRDNVGVSQSDICDTDTCRSDNQTKPQSVCPKGELVMTIGVNETPSQNSGKDCKIQIGANEIPFKDLEHASRCEKNEEIVEPECKGESIQEAVSHFEDDDEKGDSSNPFKSLIGPKERSSQAKNSEDILYDSDLKGRQSQFEQGDDNRQIEDKSRPDRDVCVLVVKELIDALLTDVLNQTRKTDSSIDDNSANMTSESTSFVTAETTGKETSGSTSDFFTADLTSESKADTTSEIAAESSQSFCGSHCPANTELTGRGGEDVLSCREHCRQVLEDRGHPLDSNETEGDSLGIPLGGEICKKLSGLMVVQEMILSSDDKANHGDVKAADADNKRPVEQSFGGYISSSPSESENINEVTSAKEKQPFLDNKCMVDFKVHGDERLPDKETQLCLTDVKTVCVSSVKESYLSKDDALKAASYTWQLPPAYQQRNLPPLLSASVLAVADTIHVPSRSAEPAEHGEEGPSTPSSRARRLMHALDEITPYSEFDAWRHRPIRLRPDCLSPLDAHEDAEGRDRGHVDDDLQLIGSLTIESLEPPVKGLIYRRKAK